jgi:hypothetical protein
MVGVKKRIGKIQKLHKRGVRKVNIELEMNIKVSSDLEMTQTKHY